MLRAQGFILVLHPAGEGTLRQADDLRQDVVPLEGFDRLDQLNDRAERKTALGGLEHLHAVVGVCVGQQQVDNWRFARLFR
ncbi:hypothetical protein D9M73_233150 [compost metagenome]